MPKTFVDDLEYLGKVILLTFIILSLFVIYNQKDSEGIILLTLACQIILVWILVKRYELKEVFTFFSSLTSTERNKRMFYIISLSILFVVALSLIFRAIIIAQRSVIIYGLIKTSYYQDILLASGLGILILGIFFIIYIIGKKIFNKTMEQLAAPAMLFVIIVIMLNNHIFHNF